MKKEETKQHPASKGKPSKSKDKDASKKKEKSASKGKTDKKIKPVDKTGDHPPPKRAPSSWIIFCGTVIEEFKKDEKSMKEGAAFKEAKTRWDAMDEKTKTTWEDMSAKAKVNVEKQKEELKKKGHYTLVDGSKSTDEKNAHLFKKKTKRAKKDAEETKEEKPKKKKSDYKKKPKEEKKSKPQ